eukprot:4222111-Alexandrium_andersonii.AAC.1
MSDRMLGQLMATCALAHLILRNKAAEFGLAMDCGGWVDGAQLVRALGAIGSLTREVTDWLVSAHARFSQTFGCPGAVLLVVLARLDHEGAIEESLLPGESEEQ